GTQLFRRHCLHCHGLTGNGQGPTAPWVNPHPRDYRPGMFKFISQGPRDANEPPPPRKPLREDLIRVMRQGVEGTSMPAFGALSNDKFGMLSEDDLEPLASAVIHLSLRGEVEFELMKTLLSGKRPTRENELGETTNVSIAEAGKDLLQKLVSQWADAPN